MALAFLVALTLAHIVWTVLGAPLEPWRNGIATLIYWPVYGLAAVLAWRAARISPPPLARMWTCMTLGLAAWGAGQVVFTGLAALNIRTFPNPAAILYLVAPLCFALGILSLVRGSARLVAPARYILDIALVVLIVGHLLWEVSGEVTAQGYAKQPVALVMALAYPVMDLILAAMLAVLALARPLVLSWVQLLLLMGALLSFMVGDVLWAVLLANGRYQLGHPLDSLWTLAAALIGLSASLQLNHWIPLLRVRSTRRTRWSLSPHYLIASGYVAYVITHLIGHDPNHLDKILLVGVTFLFAARQLLVLTENHTLQQDLLHSQSHLNTVMNTMSEAVYLKDLHGRYQLLNPAASRFLGSAVFIGPGATDVELFPEHSERIWAMDQQVVRFREPVTYELSFPALERVMLTTKHPFVVDGQLIGVLGVSRDITPQRNLELELERQVRRTRSILESLPSAFVALDSTWRFTYINPAAAALLQRPPEALMEQSVWEALPGLIGAQPARRLKRTARQRPVQFEFQSSATQRWYDVSAAPTEDGMAVSFNDVTPRKEMEATLRRSNGELEHRVRERTAELERLAYQDVLTGLPSRRAFEKRFEQTIESNRAFQLLLLDLDELKAVNDHAGHAQGDHLLQCFGSALQEAFHPYGHVYRQGGDEFIVLLTEQVVDAEELSRIMEGVRHRLGLHGYASVRASAGSASFPQDAQSPNDLLRLADQRMLRDKAAHRTIRSLRGERLLPHAPQLTAEMMWQALRATSALITTDGLMDRASWQAFLNAVTTALPSVEAASLYILEGSSFVVRAQVGYSEALIGVSHSLEAMGHWYGTERNWTLGKARILRGLVDIRAAAHLPQEWAESAHSPDALQHLGDLDYLQASLCVPVLVSGHVVAVINLDNLRSEHAFEPYEFDIAEEFGQQVAAILTSHNRRTREADRTQELEVLAHANAALNLVQEPQHLEQMLVDETIALFRTEHVAFARYAHRENVLHLVAVSGLYRDFPDQVVPEGQGVSWEAIRSKNVVHVDRLDQDPRVHTPGTIPDGTLLAAPLIRMAETPIGVLLAVRPASQAFTSLDGRLLGALASAGVTAFERLRVTAEEQRRSEELRMLAELATHVGLADNVLAVATECLTLSRTFLDADLALFTCPGRALEVTVGRGPDDFPRVAEPCGEEASGHFAMFHEPVTPDGSEHPETHLKLLPADVQGMVEVPVLERGHRVGWLALLWFRPLHTLPRTAQALMNRSAELIGQVLDREAHLADIEATREGAFRALGLSLELRDFETAGHTERVVRLALLVGEALGLSAEQLEDLRVGAYLHDIGKLAIPDAILLKPGSLDAEEWKLMQRHAVIGDELMRQIPTVAAGARSVIRHHHERWDGTGYPDRMAGSAIPLAARIFSVADVYDALTSVRPYKQAWTVEAALDELRQQAGRQFDPEVIKAALVILSSALGSPSND
ncbi:HD domain-containing phosphohydrolase [Deinococcus sp. QL22]|uniref:HD domain-containing phosphohydrolase n=1 Tax=Deinococcus sp. QL22 TaxID=2939437 RepID=UPI00201787DE|nr:HD domain-containing phosphohydrolase [Deinococcus sp. QL22]UQN09199.1 diguanylate cyclase [Deinococcus sp. QL22]